MSAAGRRILLVLAALAACGHALARDDENRSVSSRPTLITLCKRDDRAGKWPECKSGALDQQAREIEDRLRAVLARMPPLAALLLKRDAVWFREMLEIFTEEAGGDGAGNREHVTERMKSRLDDLDAMLASAGRKSLAGRWANAFGEVQVSVGADGAYSVEASTSADYGTSDELRLSCEASAVVRADAGGWLSGQLERKPDAQAAPANDEKPVPVKMRLLLQGDTLRLVVGDEAAQGPMAPEVVCEGPNQLTGTYFAANGKVVASALPVEAGAAVAPSFDCRKPETASEEEICADPELASNDQRLNRAWKILLPRLDAASQRHLTADQKSWVTSQAAQFPIFLTPPWEKRRGFVHHTAKARDELARLQRERIAMLEGFDERRAGFKGLWLAHNAIVEIQIDGSGDLTANGRKWEQGSWKDYCEYEITGTVKGARFLAEEPRVNPDTLERDGASLIVNRQDDTFARTRSQRHGKAGYDEPKCRRVSSMSSTARLFPVRPSPDIDAKDGRIR